MNHKIIAGFERISEVLKSLLWEKAKMHGISPIQIQMLLFISNHATPLCNVSSLAKEFNITKPTVSDAVRVLLKKGFLSKDDSPTDNRRYNLLLTQSGHELLKDLESYSAILSNELDGFNQKELGQLFNTLSKLIYQLNNQGIIQVQRTCFACRFYKGNKKDKHHCQLMEKKLLSQDIRLDCPEFEEKA